jgi:hypothetical protein
MGLNRTSVCSFRPAIRHTSQKDIEVAISSWVQIRFFAVQQLQFHGHATRDRYIPAVTILGHSLHNLKHRWQILPNEIILLSRCRASIVPIVPCAVHGTRVL